MIIYYLSENAHKIINKCQQEIQTTEYYYIYVYIYTCKWIKFKFLTHANIYI